MMRALISMAMLAWAGAAAADLYRWIDPESGSVKFSSYPPPWYGDPAKERRAPKVQVIPSSVSAPAAKPPADPIPAAKNAAAAPNSAAAQDAAASTQQRSARER